MKKRFIVHPVLFAVLPVVFLYSHNIGQLSLDDLLLPAALAALGALLLWLPLGLILRDAERSAAVVSLFWLAFFSYGHVLVLALKLPGTRWLRWEQYRFLYLYVPLVLVAAAFLIAKCRNRRALTSVLNAVAIVLVGWHVASVAAYEVKRVRLDRMARRAELSGAARDEGAGIRPNIYFIILDGYARADVLRDLYDYDNSEFLDYLKGKGFFVADRGRANYCQTLLSVGSCLNLDYLDDLAKRMGPKSADRYPLEKLVKESKVARFLEEQGYRTVAFSTGYVGTEIKKADIYLAQVDGLSQFQSLLLSTTPVRSAFVSRSIFGLDEADFHRRRVLHACQRLPETAKLRPPVFVFAHIICPHPPFVFDRDGNPVEVTVPVSFQDGSHHQESKEKYVRKYREQVIFINRQMRATLDRLLDTGEYPTVIILQSDHGPGSRLDWKSASNSDLRERFATLNAYYLPGDGAPPPTDDMSPVNAFRIVLNRYFGEHLPMLPNQSYYSAWHHPYQLVRVTDAVKAKGAESGAPQGGRE